MTSTPLFDSFFMAGFECSSHRRMDGVRLDLIHATGHDRHALSDYRRCAELGPEDCPRRPALAPDRDRAGRL